MVVPSEGGAEVPVSAGDESCVFCVLQVGVEDGVFVGSVADADDGEVVAFLLCGV